MQEHQWARHMDSYPMRGVFLGIAEWARNLSLPSPFLEDISDYPVSQWLRDADLGFIADILAEDEAYRTEFWMAFDKLYPEFIID